MLYRLQHVSLRYPETSALDIKIHWLSKMSSCMKKGIVLGDILDGGFLKAGYGVIYHCYPVVN